MKNSCLSLRRSSVFILAYFQSAVLGTLAPGCGSAPGLGSGTGTGGRGTLPSTIIDDPPPDATDDPGITGEDPIDPATVVDDFTDYAIVANEEPGSLGLWKFAVQSRTGQVSNQLTFVWNFSDGQVHTGPQQSFRFSDPGTHTVSVQGLNSRGEIVFVLSLDVEIPPPGLPPVANGGPDLTVTEGDSVSMDGTRSSDPDTTALVYIWAQTGTGSAVALSDPRAATTTFVAPQVDKDTLLQFTLTVSDGTSTSQDVVLVDVQNSINAASFGPTAAAGADQLITSGEIVTLNGSGSTGIGSAPLSYLWTQISGTQVTLLSSTNATTSFTAPSVTSGTVALSFALQVTQDGLPAEDEVVITVQAAAPPPPPPGGGGGTPPPTTDNCPNDPSKTEPGVCGCGVADTDSDGDGVANCNEGCPNDPNKTAAGICGCGVADTDSDGDGTANCNDGCPNDPNKTAAGACGCGTADTDSDGDGRPNCTDGCPNDLNKFAPGQCGCGAADTDSDGDGTANCVDGCPNDPLKIAAGTCGCGRLDTDGDNDGTPNCNDGCPNDPAKTSAGACGCGTPDTDSDTDGIPNCNDGCPNDPNKTNPGICGCGVADTDSDQDGIADCNDGCIGNPNVDTDGDGFLDCNDGCPNDPNKTAAGTCGCGTPDTDSDGDGRPNCNDGCPNDRNKFAPGQCGCGTPDTDSDNDGTPNCSDGCPNDPNKTTAGACGCGVADTDSDADGRANCTDGCPNDRNKFAPGQCGCGVVDTDSDADGTANCNDGCPNDPNKTAAGTCGCGTPDTDSDGDGRPNCTDGCPNDRNKFAAGQCGCGVLDTDSDGDGTANCNDGCPSDPNKTIPGLCGCGVPNLDSDNDTVCNNVDACPGFDDRIDANHNGIPDGCDAPALCLSVTSLNFGLTTTQMTFETWNCGGGTLTYGISDNATWLSASPASGGSTGEHDSITATVTRTGLADNTYQGAITVTPSIGSAVTILVSMTVAQLGGQTMTTAQRTIGAAPLAVFFDAVGTASGVVQPANGDFASLFYEWDFGDTSPPYPTWLTTGLSKNRATGFEAAHVFENPGTYRVTLTVRNSTGSINQTYTQNITVQAFSGQTYYVSTSGNDTNIGDQSLPFATFNKALSMAGPNRRILFKRGDTWTVAAGGSITSSAPCILGAYGTGNRPKIIMTSGASALFDLRNANDFRLIDLDIVGPFPTTASSDGINRLGVNCLLLRCDIAHFRQSIIQGTAPASDGSFFVDCNFNTNMQYGLYLSSGAAARNADHVAIMGTNFSGATQEHLARLYISRAVIQHCTLGSSGTGKTQMRVLATDEFNKTQYVVISDNRFGDPSPALTMLQIGSQNPDSERYLNDIVVERNEFNAGTANVGGLTGNGEILNFTVRNNVFIDTQRAISLDRNHLNNHHAGWRIVNNTFYRSQSGSGAEFVTGSDASVQNLIVKNNVVSMPNATGGGRGVYLVDPQQTLGDISSGHDSWMIPNSSTWFQVAASSYSFANWLSTGQDAGSSNVPAVAPNYGFVNAASGNLRLQTGNVGIDGGEILPWVFDDYTGKLRPKNTGGALIAGCDRGAFENN